MNQELQIKDISLMKNICSTCFKDFTSHSFNKVCDTLEGGPVFYTKISNASKYDDTKGIVDHCTKYLNHVNPEKWSWIIDFEGFGIKHTLGMSTGVNLAKLINHYGKLDNLIIINSNTLVEQMIKMIKLILNKEYHKCIEIIHNKKEYNTKLDDLKLNENVDNTIIKSLHN